MKTSTERPISDYLEVARQFRRSANLEKDYREFVAKWRLYPYANCTRVAAQANGGSQCRFFIARVDDYWTVWRRKIFLCCVPDTCFLF